MINEYTKAFFELSNELKNLDGIKESFDVFMNEYKNDFKKLLLSPNITKSEKKDIVNKCFKSCDNNFIYFLSVVIDNSRVDMLDEIYDDFIKLYDEKNNKINIEVYSNEKLLESTNNELIKKLSNKFKGKEIIIKNIIDENLLGGFKVFYNGVQIDASLKNQLDMLKTNL